MKRWWLPGAAGLAVVVVLAIVLFGQDDDTREPVGVARTVAAVMAEPQPNELGSYYCHDVPVEYAQRPEDVGYEPGEYQVGAEKRVGEGTSFVQVLGVDDPEARYVVHLLKVRDAWCVADLDRCVPRDGDVTVPDVFCRQVYSDLGQVSDSG